VSGLQYAVLRGLIPYWVNTEAEQRRDDMMDSLLATGEAVIDDGTIRLEVKW
jgi:hypothetical protein